VSLHLCALQTEECLGYAGQVYEYSLGEEKYTFVEDVRNPRSCTILIKGQNDHTIAQMKDAVRDGLRAVYNTLQDGKLVPGGGAFEVAAAHHLRTQAKKAVTGKCASTCAHALVQCVPVAQAA
jgi:T-complex protein 1 subunit zeta